MGTQGHAPTSIYYLNCSCGVPIPGALVSDRRAWHDGHALAAAKAIEQEVRDAARAAERAAVPMVDLGATVDGLIAHAASLRAAATYLEQVAAVLTGAPRAN